MLMLKIFAVVQRRKNGRRVEKRNKPTWQEGEAKRAGQIMRNNSVPKIDG
jgi:hypothetical protein